MRQPDLRRLQRFLYARLDHDAIIKTHIGSYPRIAAHTRYSMKMEPRLRIFFTILVAGLTVAGAGLGYRAVAGNDGESALPPTPKTASPSPGEGEDYWTPERLNDAKPIEMPIAPALPSSTDEPDISLFEPSQGGAGSAGDGEVEPVIENVPIPGQSQSRSGDDPTQ